MDKVSNDRGRSSSVVKHHGPRTGHFALITLTFVILVLCGAQWLGFFTRNGTPITPSAWGDVLAGVFSPLAFLWLIYAALSQRAELELQREELRQNNSTQILQQEEMGRQADILQSQLDRTRAQASAEYQPIFAVSTRQAHVDKTILHVINRGADVLDVSLTQAAIVRAAPHHMHIPDGVLAVWSRDMTAVVIIDDNAVRPAGAPDDRFFAVLFKRLDLLEFKYVYRYLSQSDRITLVKIVELPPSPEPLLPAGMP